MGGRMPSRPGGPGWTTDSTLGRAWRRAGGRNLATNPAVGIHLESGDEVVIVEGRAEEIVPDPALAARLVEDTLTKYKNRTDPADWQKGGLYVVRPQVVLAWGQSLKDPTRWRFGAA